MAGDGALFTREDAVEAAWAVVDPVLKTHHRVRPYKRRSWGPKEADALIATDGGWHNPRPERAPAMTARDEVVFRWDAVVRSYPARHYCAVRKIGNTANRTAQSGESRDEGRRPAPLGKGPGGGPSACVPSGARARVFPRTEQRGGRCWPIIPRCVVCPGRRQAAHAGGDEKGWEMTDDRMARQGQSVLDPGHCRSAGRRDGPAHRRPGQW